MSISRERFTSNRFAARRTSLHGCHTFALVAAIAMTGCDTSRDSDPSASIGSGQGSAVSNSVQGSVASLPSPPAELTLPLQASDSPPQAPQPPSVELQVPRLQTPNLQTSNPQTSNSQTPDPTSDAQQPRLSAPNLTYAKPAPEELDADGFVKPEDYNEWDKPDVALVFTGNQHGYIEPCGCTGLTRQKGGVARRLTFLHQLQERQWDVVPMDVGNQVRRFGRQAAIKMQQSAIALEKMGYEAVGFGPEDVRLGVGDLLAVAAADSPEDATFISANVVLFDPDIMPQIKFIDRGGLKIAVTAITDPASLVVETDGDVMVNDMRESLATAMATLEIESPDFNVLLFFGEEESAKDLVREVKGADLVVVSGGHGEPTYQATSIAGSSTRMIVTGDKGMYAGIVGLYGQQNLDDQQNTSPMLKYARVPLTHEFGDAPEMRALMKDYQDQLKDVGLEGLGLLPPIPHSSGRKFVGTATCGKCHTEAMDIWESSAHAHATDSIVSPPEDRGDVARHFDPECISCHVTGWNAQEYYPYDSGYLSLAASKHLTGNGCENCHGPGAEHSAAEEEGSGVAETLRDELRIAMRLPLDKAREKCMSCHDLDNSPDFHEPDAFEDVYWPEVEHYGLE